MENTFKKAETQKTKNKKVKCTGTQQHQGASRFVTYALMSYALFVFGCNESARTADRSNSVRVNDLAPEAMRIIQEGLADDSPRIRAKAVEVVADTKRTELMPRVQQLLKDEFVPVRFAAALAVGDLKYHRARKSVKQLLKDEDENARIAAAYALDKVGSFDSLELLTKAIASRDQTVRANAAMLLGKSGNKSTLKLLYQARRDKNSDDKVQFQTVESIAMLGDERIYSTLWAMLISVYADDRVMGIRSMGALGTIEAKNALIRKLDDDILDVRLAAAEQLGMLGDTTGEAEVLDVFTKNFTAGLDKEELEHVNLFAALAIGQIGTAQLTKFLPQLLQNESKFVRIAAAKAVFQCVMRK